MRTMPEPVRVRLGAATARRREDVGAHEPTMATKLDRRQYSPARVVLHRRLAHEQQRCYLTGIHQLRVIRVSVHSRASLL
jgi:hypothetical protein